MGPSDCIHVTSDYMSAQTTFEFDLDYILQERSHILGSHAHATHLETTHTE